jgi:hypothetical protein
MKTTEKFCEGSCEKHIGEVRRVHVYGKNGYDWGEFDYCDTAINEDINRGMTIKNINQ